MDESLRQNRSKLLELHQVKSIEIMGILKERFPGENLYTLSTSLLILLIPLVEDRTSAQILIRQLAKTLDAGVAIGLLSEQERLPADFTLPTDAGDSKENTDSIIPISSQTPQAPS